MANYVYRILNANRRQFANKGGGAYHRFAKPGKPGYFWPNRGALTMHLRYRDKGGYHEPYEGAFIVTYEPDTLEEVKRIFVSEWEDKALARLNERKHKQEIASQRAIIRMAEEKIEKARKRLKALGVSDGKEEWDC